MSRATAIFTRFDSAWTATNEGAIAHVTLADDVLTLVPPVVAGFDAALAQIEEQGAGGDLHVIGIDQPLIVANETGRRPVEKALYPLIGTLKGGMQPANRGKTAMFGDSAPVWQFLIDLKTDLDWRKSVMARSGRFAIEVYPAVAFAGLFPHFLERKRLPKYNPTRKSFSPDDWRQLCALIGQLGGELGIAGTREFCSELAILDRPRKSDQDKLDAVICVIITYLWWRFGRERSMVIGDLATGYIVTPTNPVVSADVGARARLLGVPVDAVIFAPPV